MISASSEHLSLMSRHHTIPALLPVWPCLCKWNVWCLGRCLNKVLAVTNGVRKLPSYTGVVFFFCTLRVQLDY